MRYNVLISNRRNIIINTIYGVLFTDQMKYDNVQQWGEHIFHYKSNYVSPFVD